MKVGRFLLRLLRLDEPPMTRKNWIDFSSLLVAAIVSLWMGVHLGYEVVAYAQGERRDPRLPTCPSCSKDDWRVYYEFVGIGCFGPPCGPNTRCGPELLRWEREVSPLAYKCLYDGGTAKSCKEKPCR